MTGDAGIAARRGGEGVIAWHVLGASQPATVVSARGIGVAAGADTHAIPDPVGDPMTAAALVAASSAAADAGHGVNAHGLLVAGEPWDVVRHLLEEARSIDDALVLLESRARAQPPARLWLADADGAATIVADSRLRHERPQPVTAMGSLDLTAAIERTRASTTATSASALVATLGGSEPAVHLCLGPPWCGVFIRVWSGIEVGPLLTGEDGGPAELGRLAAQLAAAVEAGTISRTLVRAELDAAERRALAEGEDAERMAVRMEAPGDDRGAEVRRAVSIVHAADIAADAMGRLGGVHLDTGRG